MKKPLSESTYVRVAAMTGVHPGTVRRYFTERRRVPLPLTVAAIRSALAQLGIEDPRPELQAISALPNLQA